MKHEKNVGKLEVLDTKASKDPQIIYTFSKTAGMFDG